MILVTGPTGTIGSALLPRLADLDLPVRALVRRPAGRDAVEASGAEAVEGDLDRPETLERAMEGCDRLFLLSPADPALPEREVAAVDAAARAGVRQVVALSVIGADARSNVAFARWHAAVEGHLAASGLGWTLLRPAGFMQSHLLPMGTVRAEGTWYGMTGDGAAGFVDGEDVAAVAAAVLADPGSHAGATYELTGPQAISMPQAAAQLGAALGRDVTYVDVPAPDFRAGLVDAGLPDWVADSLVALYQGIREGHAATVTNWVERITGRPARSYRDFLAGHAEQLAATTG